MNLSQLGTCLDHSIAAEAAQTFRACIAHANEISQNSGIFSENAVIGNGGNPYHVHMHGKTRITPGRGR